MRIYVNELIKGLCKKSVLGIIIVLAVLNGVLLWLNESQKDCVYTTTEYREIYDDLDGLSTEKAFEKINLYSKKLDIFEQLSTGCDVSDLTTEYPEFDFKVIADEYKNKTYLKYTNDIFTEMELVSDVKNEIESCTKYEDYLTGIDETAKKMTSISLFSKPDTFSYKNIQKTPKDFAHLKGSTLKPAPSKGIAMATDFLPTDLLGFMIILTICVNLITREKELHQNLLSRTTFKGRKKLGIAKLFSCFTIALISEVILYTINFSVAYFTYGFGDLSRQIQSAIDFNSSNLQISVLQYFLWFLFGKLVVFFIYTALIYIVTVSCNSAVKAYSLLVLIISIEAVLYYTIPSASYLCLFKYVNILAFANTMDLFAKYLNLNLFGIPVNYINVFIVSSVILLLVLSLISVFIYDKKRPIQNHRSSCKMISFSKGRNVSIFLQECYKIFIGGKVLFILLIFAIASFMLYSPIKENFSTQDEIYYKEYMLKLEGEYTPQKQKFIDEEEKKFSDAEKEMEKEISNNNGGILAMMKFEKILAPQQAFEQIKNHSEYLKVTKNSEFVYDSGYKLLTGDESAGNKDLILALIAMTMVLCCLAYAYSVEYQTGTNVLLKTSLRGRGYTFICKSIIGIIIIAIIFAITYIPYFYNVLSAYGIRKINSPISSIEAFAGWNISIKAYLILISINRFLAMIIAMFIIYFISSKLKSLILTLILGAGILILPILLSLLGISFFDYVLLNPLIIGNL